MWKINAFVILCCWSGESELCVDNSIILFYLFNDNYKSLAISKLIL